MTTLQVNVMMAARGAYPRWFRARRNGERVTLASLYRGGLMERRTRRGVEGQSNAAYAYRPTPAFIAECVKEGL